MTNRVVVLSDEELQLVLSWAEVAESVDAAGFLPDEVVAHDWEDDDDDLAAKMKALQP